MTPSGCIKDSASRYIEHTLRSTAADKNDMKDKSYSVVVPVFNSEKTLDELYSRLTAVLQKVTDDYEIILVDDCSSDGSWEKLKRLHENDGRVKVIHLIRNFGQHNATLCGLKHCTGSYVIILDDDLQHPPEEIPKLIEKIEEGYLVVYGRYKTKYHGCIENVFSRIFQFLMHRILKIPKDIFISSFAIFSSEIIENVVSTRTSHVFLPALISKNVAINKIANAKVNHAPRRAGHSNYNPMRHLRLSLNLVLNYSALPLAIVSVFGLFLSTLSMIFGATIIVKKIAEPSSGVMGWNSLMVATTFLGGATLMSLGIIGEYLRRILSEVSYEQQFVVGEAHT